MEEQRRNEARSRADAALGALHTNPEDDRALECLLERVFTTPDGDRPRRREELVELAETRLGLGRSEAEEVYDVARAEGLDPAYAFELVRCGIAVCDFEVPDAEPIVDTGEPDWVDERPSAAPERERRLRTSFRRLRGLLESSESPEAALDTFVRDPSVDDCGYG